MIGDFIKEILSSIFGLIMLPIYLGFFSGLSLFIYFSFKKDFELTITDYMEIIPTIQRYIPHIGVIEPDELKDRVKSNIELYLKRFG